MVLVLRASGRERSEDSVILLKEEEGEDDEDDEEEDELEWCLPWESA